MRRIAAIALGSNLASQWGDREANLREAIARVAKLGEVRAVSSFHDTAPVGFIEQPNFLNGTMLLATELEPVELMRALLAIERAMGRDRAAVSTDAAQSGAAPIKGPRIIDLDLLLYGELVIESRGLILPHPRLHQRRFVLDPLCDLAPNLLHPILQKTMLDLRAAIPRT